MITRRSRFWQTCARAYLAGVTSAICWPALRQLAKISVNLAVLRAVDDETGRFYADPKLRFPHPYPATKVMFIPDKDCSRPDLLATTGDYLRIWHVGEDGVKLQKLLNNVSQRWDKD